MRSLFRTQARWAAAGVLLLAGLAGPPALGAARAASAAGTSAAGTSAASTAVAAAGVPRYRHIAVLIDTDHDYGSISRNRYAPVLNRLASQYGLASHYYTVADPDIANEVALLAGNSFGASNDFPYWDEQIHEPSLLSQLVAAHQTWKAYVQSLPYPGYLGDCYPTQCLGTPQTDTLYNQVKFNGVPDFASVADNPAQARNMVPATELTADARDGRLPNFSLILPNECDDMHGGPPWCEDGTSNYHEPNDNHLVAGGDAYIGQVVREIMSGPQWKHGNNAIVITFTEGDTSAGCCGVKPGTGHVMTVVITSHGPRRLADPTPYNHYSLLSTLQHAFGLGCLQATCNTQNVVPMARLFGGTADAAAGRSGFSAAEVATTPAAARASAGRVAASSAASPWHRVRSPNIGSDDNNLGAIAGRSPSDIWAVGAMLPPRQPDITSTLTVHYNGKKWSDVRTPNAGRQASMLFGVAALPDGTAWAVGSYTTRSGRASRTLAEHWNGHRWAIVPSASPGPAEDVLYGVTAVSDSEVWAVGTYTDRGGAFRDLVEHWNGHRWLVWRSPSPGAAGDTLYAVTSGAGGVFAGGQELSGRAPDRQLILGLGSRPGRSEGSGGSGGSGQGWQVDSRVATRGPAGAGASVYPQAIATSAVGLWVAGDDRSGHAGFSSLVEAPAAGGRLTRLATPNPTAQDNYLWGIAPVGGGGTAWAVGNSVQKSSGNYLSLTEHGSARGGWTIVPSPDPGLANGGNTILGAVLAFGSRDVWAVGTYDGINGRRTLILHYTGPVSRDRDQRAGTGTSEPGPGPVNRA